jgi:hypothetical protein
MKERVLRWWAALAAGGMFFLGDCDPAIQQTVEDGVISSSTALITAFFQGLVEAATANV